jgi:hypothetical protein
LAHRVFAQSAQKLNVLVDEFHTLRFPTLTANSADILVAAGG